MSNRVVIQIEGLQAKFVISPLDQQRNRGLLATDVDTGRRVRLLVNETHRKPLKEVIHEFESVTSRKSGLLSQGRRLVIQSVIETAIPQAEVVGPDSLKLF